MNFVLDMNLAPRWCGALERRGHGASHWSRIGEANAPDADVMNWARENDHVVLTHDLDYGVLLALTRATGPSVIQIRTKAPLPDLVGEQVFAAIAQYRSELELGALLTIDPARSRVRLLPIRRL